MKKIGKGLTYLKMLCGYLNMPPPLQIARFNSLQNIDGKAYETVITDSMNNAAHELLINERGSEYVTENNILYIALSGDGSWQKRGQSPLNSVVTLVASDTGKCVDYRVLSKHCPSCKSWETKKNMRPDAYEEFVTTHNCSINHTGSSGAMEAAGLVDCFKSSIQNRGLRYTNFIGDGDSKSYLEIVANDPYSGVTVQKLECVGHFQKRVGARLRKLKSEIKGKLSDGKPLTGKGPLTEKVINNYKIILELS